MHRTTSTVRDIALGLAVAVALGGAMVAARQVTIDPVKGASRVTVKDPCEVASADTLKSVLTAGLAPYFPMSHSSDGEKVTLSDPTITEAKCPGLRITVKAKIRYQKTQGFPQGSVSGDMRFTSPLELRVRHSTKIHAGTPIPADQVQSARACLTNINVTALNLNNVPNWLDNGWIREKVLDPKLKSACFDVTGLVTAYIQHGGVVKAS